VVAVARLTAGALFAIVASRTALTAEWFAALLAFRALGAFFRRSLFPGLGQFLVAVLVVELVLAARTLILEPGAALAQHAEIMVRELQIIFGLDPVARKLGIARHALVFLKQLGGIAALAIVLPVARLSAEVPASLPTTAAPTAALSIIDQIPTSLRSSCSPFASVGQGDADAPALTFSFRSWREARSERPIVSGLGQERSSVDLERARPRPLM
jgi:hypothetical protein